MKNLRFSVNLPESWQELTDNQLYYLYSLLADNLSLAQVKTYCFFRWSGLKILRSFESGAFEIQQGQYKGRIHAGVIAAGLHVLDWIGELPDKPVRISKLKGHLACDASLLDFSFEKYLYCDNLYQGYMESQNHKLLIEMGRLLYDCETMSFNQAEKISVFYWWAGVKSLFSRTFVNFLTPMSTESIIEGGTSLQHTLQAAMNAQIRALTGGDITKHRQVLEMDVWTAMWELDAKAQEYNEMQQKYGK